MTDFKKDKCRYLEENGEQCQNHPKDGQNLCEDHLGVGDRHTEVYRAVTDHFRQDLREFFSRSNFFLVAEAALLSAFYAIQTKLISPPNLVNLGDLWSNKALAFAGLLLTVIWLFVSCSSVYWIRRWRREVYTVSEDLSNISSYKKVEEVGPLTDLLRPEHITVLLPVLFLGLWAFALFKVLC
ncbi:MAG: hypothetical protein V3R54_05320 [Thermodesulfovibrionia bacterium]